MNNDNFNNEMKKILDLLQQGNQTANIQPNTPLSIEQLLIKTILNPVWLKTKKKYLTDCQGNNEVIAGSREGSLPHSSGFTEEINDEFIPMLDDGTSSCGIVICQTCGGRVKEENIRRCVCGRTCCLREGCAKYSEEKEEWYCSNKHKIMRSLGFSLR